MDENQLWSGESVWCQCGHHVECHETGMATIVFWDRFYAHCHFKGKDKKDIGCSCQEFTPYKQRET